MTAHIVYEALDPDVPATMSSTIIRDVIRGRIGFEGVLVTDDLAMKALTGAPADLAAQALAAGCDIALYCSGDFPANEALLSTCPPLTPEAQARLRAGPDPAGGQPDDADRRHRWPTNARGCFREFPDLQSCPGRRAGDPGDHPARSGARLRRPGAWRHDRPGCRPAVAESHPAYRPCRHHHPARHPADQPACVPAAQDLLHVRLGQAGAGFRLEVPRSPPRHGAGGDRRAADELLPGLAGRPGHAADATARAFGRRPASSS